VWRRRKGLTCEQLVELVTDYLEGKLSRTDRRRFESHIDACGNCREYLAQFRETMTLTRTLREEDVDRRSAKNYSPTSRGGAPSPALLERGHPPGRSAPELCPARPALVRRRFA
jgi:anti-sigma factor RsiW